MRCIRNAASSPASRVYETVWSGRHVNQGERSNPDCRKEGEILLMAGQTRTPMRRASLSMLGDIPDENQVETAATATI
jgi:hypothetical protein